MSKFLSRQERLALERELSLERNVVYKKPKAVPGKADRAVLFLPPYSPNLNLIERLWRFLKKVVLYNRYYEKFADFRSAILNFFKNIKQYKDELASLMTLKFHTLGA
jgi:transposase